MSDFLIEQENKMIRLVEERGVAAFPYRTAINEIMEWCQKQTTYLTPGQKTAFTVPKWLTAKIDFVIDLTIDVTVEDGENFAYHSGGGVLQITWGDRIIDGKYDKARIKIQAFSYYGDIYERTILNSLNHELNHFYEAWKELARSGTMSLYSKQAVKGNANITCLTDAYNRKANQIIYRLYCESELNALIAGDYGDLAGFKSHRKRFTKDLKHLQAYYLYTTMLMDLDDLIFYFQQIHPEHVKPFIQELKRVGIELNPYYKNNQGYIKEFGRRTKFLLKTLIRGIGKVASLYYDSIEVPENNFEITINNKK